MLLPVTILFESPSAAMNLDSIVGSTWLGLIGGLFSYTLWFRGIALLPGASAAVLGLLSPLVAAVLGILVLSETLELLQFVGFVRALPAMVAGQVTQAADRRR
ncbi:UNVERIFIED_ORG: putative blue pigment (indigoidine) exporter [Gordonia westfalica J30]